MNMCLTCVRSHPISPVRATEGMVLQATPQEEIHGMSKLIKSTADVPINMHHSLVLVLLESYIIR